LDYIHLISDVDYDIVKEYKLVNDEIKQLRIEERKALSRRRELRKRFLEPLDREADAELGQPASKIQRQHQ
jgi:hypothetical protein